jgi:hypothetical protein
VDNCTKTIIGQGVPVEAVDREAEGSRPVKYRIHAKNPRTQQAHDFDVECESMADARAKADAAGLVLLTVMPALDSRVAPAHKTPRIRSRRRFWRRPRRRVVNIALLAGILFAVVAAVPVMLAGRPPDFQSLAASIRFDGFKFSITNQDDFAWKDVRVDLNGGLAHSGYLHHPGTIVAGQAYTVSAASFRDAKGGRFSPVTDEPRQMTITCHLEDGRTGRYTKRWH